MEVLGLADGAALVITGMASPPTADEPPAQGTLSLPAEVATWIGEAVAAGVTFEVLKEASVALVRQGWTKKGTTATAESVTQAVVQYLCSCGYIEIVVSEVRRVSGQGWTLTGTADGSRFGGMADDGGNLVHVRVR